MLKEVFLNTDVIMALDLFSLCPNFLKVRKKLFSKALSVPHIKKDSRLDMEVGSTPRPPTASCLFISRSSAERASALPTAQGSGLPRV